MIFAKAMLNDGYRMASTPTPVPDEFKKRLILFDQTMVGARVVAGIGHQSLLDFPKNLPEFHLNLFQEAVRLEVRRVGDKGLEWKEGPDGTLVASPRLPELDPNVSSNDIISLIDLRKSYSDCTTLIDQLPFEQFIIVAFAQTEAVLTDLLKWICVREPRILKSNRKIDWSTLIDAGSWEIILSLLVDRLCLEKGFDSIKGRIEHFRDLGIEPEIDPEVLIQVEFAEQVRHLLCHTGGFVSSRFLEITKSSDYDLGDRLGVDAAYCRALSSTLISIVHGLADTAFLKFANRS